MTGTREEAADRSATTSAGSTNRERVREATPSDIANIHQVRLAVRENTLSSPGRITSDEYLAVINGLGRGWVIESDDMLVAFAFGLRTGNIWALFVHPAHERRGYGQALHATMTEWLWSQGLRRLWLTTDPGTRAEQFYRAQGWQACGRAENGELRLELEAPSTSM